MVIIQHRVNQIDELLQTPTHLGVEVDVRSNGNELYLSHDPFVAGQSFAEYLSHFDHSFIVVNVKEEGLEKRCVELLRTQGIKNYFFLDQSIPFLIKRGLEGMKDGACRISDYEAITTVKRLAPFCNWAWVDSFKSGGTPIKDLSTLREIGFKICLVSPELHGQHRQGEIPDLILLTQELDFQIDAVCTKFPEKWAQV